MPVHDTEVAEIFEQLAELLEILEENPFRIRAYRNAAQLIRGQARSMSELLDSGADLTELPGIGQDTAAKIATILRTGKLPLLDQLRARVPAPLLEMTRVAGLGPKRAKALYSALNIRSPGRSLAAASATNQAGGAAGLAPVAPDAAAGGQMSPCSVYPRPPKAAPKSRRCRSPRTRSRRSQKCFGRTRASPSFRRKSMGTG